MGHDVHVGCFLPTYGNYFRFADFPPNKMAASLSLSAGNGKKQRIKRDVNFSDAELRVLLDLIKDHHNVLSVGTLDGTAVTAKRKKKKELKIWELITSSVNARGSGTRTVKQVKKKWFDLKSQALKIKSNAKNPPTGGGAREDEPWFVDVVLDINGENSCLLQGIQGKLYDIGQNVLTFQGKRC